MKRASLVALALALIACTEDLGLDEQRFRCATDDDCIRGTVCDRPTRTCRAPRPPEADAGPRLEPDAAEPPGPVTIRWGTTTATPTAWWWYRDLTAAQLDERVAALGARIHDLEVDASRRDWLYTAVLLDDRGPLHVPWSWQPARPREQLTLSGQPRMADVEMAVTGTVPRFAVVFSGPGNYVWWWGSDRAFLTERMRANRQIIDVERYDDQGEDKLAAVMIARTRSTNWHEGQTPHDLAARVADGQVGLTALEPQDEGRRFIVVTASCPCARSELVYDVDAEALDTRTAEAALRIDRLVRYVRDGAVLYAAILVGN